jgi:Ca-activated chloride channel family protein
VRSPALALVAVAPLLFGFKMFESRNGEIEQGNAAMQAGKAEEALAHYDKAVAKLPGEAGVHLDRGAALYALSRFDEARQEFLRATEGGQDTALKGSAFRNLGNALSKLEKHKDAVEAYKRALALRPDDKAAKWNLEIALRKQKEEEKKQEDKDKKDDKQDDKDKKDDKKKDDKDKDKKDDKKDQEKKDQDKKDDKQDKTDKQDKQDKQEKQPQPEKAAENQPERIQQMLKNLEANPKDLERERARLRAVRRAAPARDW